MLVKEHDGSKIMFCCDVGWEQSNCSPRVAMATRHRTAQLSNHGRARAGANTSEGGMPRCFFQALNPLSCFRRYSKVLSSRVFSS